MHGELIKGCKLNKYKGLFTLTFPFEKVVRDGDEILKKTDALGGSDWISNNRRAKNVSVLSCGVLNILIVFRD